MDALQDRILVVENDPTISDLIGRQTLQSVGYQVDFVEDASMAIPAIQRMAPDVILLDLHLPGLSGKDFLVALASQGIEVPVIVLARKGEENTAIQAFRLGACDYLLWPARDAEVLASVERTLKQIHARKARVEQANQELNQRIQELTAVCNLGKTLTAITDLRQLCDKTVQSAVQLTGADAGWLAMLDDAQKTFFLAAQCNLPDSLASRMNKPWEDGLSPLIAQSGESLSMHGEALKKIRAVALGQAVLLTPIKLRKQTLGVLGVSRTAKRPFSPEAQRLIRETAGFAAVGLVNARHFYALEERAHRQAPVKASAACEKKRTSIVQSLTTEVHWLLEYSRQSVQNLAEGGDATLPAEQRQGLLKAGQRISQGERAVDLMAVVCQGSLPSQTAQDLAGLIKHELPAFQRMARQAGKEIASEVPVAPLPVALDAALLKAILAGLVSYALQVSPARQRLTLQAVPMDAQHAQLRLFTPGVRLENNLFNRPVVSQDLEQRCGPQGLSLAGLKEIAAAAGGKVLIENAAGSEPALILVLPLCESSPH